jgi:hypothetical protein
MSVTSKGGLRAGLARGKGEAMAGEGQEQGGPRKDNDDDGKGTVARRDDAICYELLSVRDSCWHIPN